MSAPPSPSKSAVNHPPLPAQTAPPTVMGVYYREHTLYPVHHKLGRNIVLFNKTVGVIAPPDHRGCIKLDPHAEYIPERNDSERLKKLMDDARRAAKHSSSSSGGSKWASRVSGSLSNLTIGRRRSSATSFNGKTISRRASGLALADNNNTGHATPPQTAASADALTQSARELTVPGEGGGSISNFFGTIRGRRRSNESSNSIGATGGAPVQARPRSHSQDRTQGANAFKQQSADHLSRNASGLSGMSNGSFAVDENDGDEEEDAEVSLEDFLKGASKFKSTPNVNGPDFAPPLMPGAAGGATSAAATLTSNLGFVPASRTMSPVTPISEDCEGHGAAPVSEIVDVAMFGSLIMVTDGRPGTVWVNLHAGHVHLYSDPNLRHLVDSIAVADNCLAMPDARPGADPGAFHVLQDDICFALVAKTRDEMLNWVSTINTATLAHITSNILQATSGSQYATQSSTSSAVHDNTCDYRKEYEEIVKSFDLVELARVKLPPSSPTSPSKTLSTASSVAPSVGPGTEKPVGVPRSAAIAERLKQLRQDHRISMLRQTVMTDMSNLAVNEAVNTHLRRLSITTITDQENEDSPNPSPLPSPLPTDHINLPPADEPQPPSTPTKTSGGTPPKSAAPVSEEFQAERINAQSTSPVRDVGIVQTTVECIGNSIPRSMPPLKLTTPTSSSPPPGPIITTLGMPSSPCSVSSFPSSPIITTLEPPSRRLSADRSSIRSTDTGTSSLTSPSSYENATQLPVPNAPLLRRSNESADSTSSTGTGGNDAGAHISYASLDRLVERLACDLPYDPKYVDTFLIGYRHVAPAAVVLDKLFARMYCVAPSGAGDDELKFVAMWRPVVRLRVVAVLKQWVERYWCDFLLDASAREHLDEMLQAMEKFEPEDDEVGVVASEQRAYLARLAKLIRKMVVVQQAKANTAMTSSAPQLAESSGAKGVETPMKHPPPCDFLDLDPVHVAVQLTIMEFKRFKSVRPIECVLNLWADTKDPAVQKELKALTEMVSSFNQVSYWVATEICTQPELPNRIKVVERMIKIAKICKRERNYNTLVAIIAGLSNSAVLRLKQTWEGVQDKYRQKFEDLEDLVSQTHNFKNYRHILDTMEHEGWRYPFVPFFGLFLKDLMFWNENAKLNDAGLINFSKLRSIARLVQDLRRWQQHEYVPTPGLTVQQSGSSQPSSPSTMSSSLIPLSAMPGASGASSQSHGVPDLVEKYCKNLRALKEQNIYKYSCLCERKAGAGAGDSVRLIEKWASQTTGDKVSGKGR